MHNTSTISLFRNWRGDKTRVSLLLLIAFIVFCAQWSVSAHGFDHLTHEQTEQCALYSPFDHGKALFNHQISTPTAAILELDHCHIRATEGISRITVYASRAPPVSN